MSNSHTDETVGPHRRRKFLEALAEEPSVRRACRQANIGRTTLYALRENDPAFRQAWDKALSIGNHVLIDVAIERHRRHVRQSAEMADPEPFPRVSGPTQDGEPKPQPALDVAGAARGRSRSHPAAHRGP